MFAPRFIVSALISAPLLFTVTNASTVFLPAANAKIVAKPAHQDSLHLAAHELKHAHAAVTGKNSGKAGQHVSAAIGHIEHAIHSHKTNQLNQNRTGVTGAIATAAHHQHHNQLHEALHAAKAAEKQLASGNTAQAASDITKAHHHVEKAIQQQHALNVK
jgi:hypothetical protein